MSPRRARYTRIERIVDVLLSSAPAGPPVAIERMVREHGIDLRRGDLGEVSGLLVRDGQGTVIGVNSTQSPVRQRFTIAHEFGHYMLHDEISEHVDHAYSVGRRPATEQAEPRVYFRSEASSQATDVEEIEANFFAASLLMPRAMLDSRNAVAAMDDDRAVRQLARDFNVSQHAMSLRLANVYRQFAPF